LVNFLTFDLFILILSDIFKYIKENYSIFVSRKENAKRIETENQNKFILGKEREKIKNGTVLYLAYYLAEVYTNYPIFFKF